MPESVFHAAVSACVSVAQEIRAGRSIVALIVISGDFRADRGFVPLCSSMFPLSLHPACA
jgi:hypothetical protein